MEELKKRFIWNSFNASSFNEMPNVDGDAIIVIANAYNPSISIFDAKGLSEDEKMELAKQQAMYITSGCNYHYEVVKVIGNTYFFN